MASGTGFPPVEALTASPPPPIPIPSAKIGTPGAVPLFLLSTYFFFLTFRNYGGGNCNKFQIAWQAFKILKRNPR